MKKSNVNLKDVLGKLDFLKDNLGLLFSVLIVVVAGLLFLPTRILRGRLQTTIQKQSVQPAHRIDSLIEDVNKASEAEALEQYIDGYARDANQVELLARQTTWRELLSYDLFPDMNESFLVLFENFGAKFTAGIETMLRDVGAGLPPTNAEIDAALKNAPRSPYQPGGGYGAYGRSGASPMMPTTPGMPGGGARMMSYRMMSETERKIVDRVCVDKAQEARVYANPIDLEGYVFWKEWQFEDRDKAYKACWYWQMGYWMIEDVLHAIQAMNGHSPNIVTAPVKRIMNMNFVLQRGRAGGMRPMAMRSRYRRRTTTDRDKQMPAYVTSAKDGMTTPCTGRYTSEESGIDVMHFNVRVILREDAFLPFLQELCRAKEHKFRGFYGKDPEQTFKHNQITVLETNLTPVNLDSFEHQSYRYGDEPVAELDLICEYIFDRKAYDDIMPQLVKNDILDATENAQPGRR